MASRGPNELTWAALLGKWVDFARASLALPKTPDADRLRAVVPDIINLQAVTMALGEFDALPVDDRAVAIDRASVLVRRADDAIAAQWKRDSIPDELAHIVQDAHDALESARKVLPASDRKEGEFGPGVNAD